MKHYLYAMGAILCWASLPVATGSVAWEEAAQSAIKAAGLSLRDLRIAEVKTLDMVIDGNKAAIYRAKVKLSFKILSE